MVFTILDYIGKTDKGKCYLLLITEDNVSYEAIYFVSDTTRFITLSQEFMDTKGWVAHQEPEYTQLLQDIDKMIPASLLLNDN